MIRVFEFDERGTVPSVPPCFSSTFDCMAQRMSGPSKAPSQKAATDRPRTGQEIEIE